SPTATTRARAGTRSTRRRARRRRRTTRRSWPRSRACCPSRRSIRTSSCTATTRSPPAAARAASTAASRSRRRRRPSWAWTANTVYMVYLGDQDRHLWLVSSKDSGAHWSKPLDVTAPGLAAANLPALTAGDDGRLALAYVGTVDPQNVKIKDDDAAALDNETY